MKRFCYTILVFVVLIGVWEAAFRARLWNPVLMPSPIAVARYLVEATLDSTLPGAIVVTMKRLVSGYLFGLVLGLPLGLLTARFKIVEDSLGMIALGLQTLPSVCWVPLALLWFGQ